LQQLGFFELKAKNYAKAVELLEQSAAATRSSS